ncbi:Na+/H+ antiporter NhaC family protein [Alloscardovia venturai]|uniref:Na+/H+ antiporter NhaC family protein n=1 Tax=Alloscardovia venturai TaxID=1769421 RepID=A0ABW2Y651_9BIFI
MMKETQPAVQFYGGKVVAFLPVVIFLGFCIEFFVVLKAFDMGALAMAALIALLLTALFVKGSKRKNYWEAVYNGVKESAPILVLLLVIGMFSQLIKTSQLSGGFVFLARSIHMSGSIFTAMIFLFVCIIATATGSSLGTMFTCFPIFYPAGVLLGANPAFLAAAIVSGGIFGDNLAPISDTTVISASTQHYSHRSGTAEIGGVVRTRFKYSAVAGIIAFLVFAIFGGNGASSTSDALSKAQVNPMSLFMLISVVLMLIVAVIYKDIYLSITVGIIVGVIVGLATGSIHPSDIISVKDGAPVGFLVEGVSGMMSTVILVLAVYGIMGVLHEAGALDMVLHVLSSSRLGRSVVGTELMMMLGITLTTLLFGGVTSAAMATFGKVQDELGRAARLHPYRRANLLDGFANGLAVCVPFLSVFVFIGSQLTQGYTTAPTVSILELSAHLVYPFLLFLVLLTSVLTGWGRIYEDEDGEEIKRL